MTDIYVSFVLHTDTIAWREARGLPHGAAMVDLTSFAQEAAEAAIAKVLRDAEEGS